MYLTTTVLLFLQKLSVIQPCATLNYAHQQNVSYTQCMDTTVLQYATVCDNMCVMMHHEIHLFPAECHLQQRDLSPGFQCLQQ